MGVRSLILSLMLPLIYQFGSIDHVQGEDYINYSCQGDEVMLVTRAYTCSDDVYCSHKLYDTPDVVNAWSACNYRNSCDVAITQGFLVMQKRCVRPDQIMKHDVCSGGVFTMEPRESIYFHNPGYPDRLSAELTCTCSTNLTRPTKFDLWFLEVDLLDGDLRIALDDSGSKPNATQEITAPIYKRFEIVYENRNTSRIWIQLTVNASVEFYCEREEPVVVLPIGTKEPPDVLTSSAKIVVLLGASSGVILVFLILIPVLVVFIYRHKKRRAARREAWNEMVRNAEMKHTQQHMSTLRCGTDRIRKLPKDGTTVNLYQTLDPNADNANDGEWLPVQPTFRSRPGPGIKERPRQKLPGEEEEELDAEGNPYCMYESLSEDGSLRKKNHPYEDVDSDEGSSGGGMKVNEQHRSRENVGQEPPHSDDWNDLYQMASTLGRNETDWKTNELYQSSPLPTDKLEDKDLPKFPHVARPYEPGSGRYDSPSSPSKVGTVHSISPPGNYDNARDLKPQTMKKDLSGYDNSCAPKPAGELGVGEKVLEEALLDLGKTLIRMKKENDRLKTINKKLLSSGKGTNNLDDDTYEAMP